MAVTALAVSYVRSSFFEDARLFPPGTAELDSGLLMSGIPATWRAHEPLMAGAEPVAAS